MTMHREIEGNFGYWGKILHKTTPQPRRTVGVYTPTCLLHCLPSTQVYKAIMKAHVVSLFAIVGVASSLSSHLEHRLPPPPPSAPSKCKCYPGEPCWPSTADWGNLNQTVGGRLVKATPPGAVCYDSFEGVPTRDPAKCAEVASQWTNASWT